MHDTRSLQKSHVTSRGNLPGNFWQYPCRKRSSYLHHTTHSSLTSSRDVRNAFRFFTAKEAMHAFTRKGLCKTPKLSTGKGATAITIPQVSAYPRLHPSYKTMCSAPSAKKHKETEPPSAEDDKQYGNREDMAEAFGVAYATRSSEEGYGERYEENVKVMETQKDTSSTAERNAREEYDESQGSKVKEKEQGRHATEESAYPPPDRPLPGGAGGAAS